MHFAVFPELGGTVYLVSLSAGLVKAVKIVFFDSVNRHINLYIKFLSTAWKVGTLFVTNKWLALVHLGHFNRILTASLYTTFIL